MSWICGDSSILLLNMLFDMLLMLIMVKLVVCVLMFILWKCCFIDFYVLCVVIVIFLWL